MITHKRKWQECERLLQLWSVFSMGNCSLLNQVV